MPGEVSKGGTNSAFKKYTQGHTQLPENGSLNMEGKAPRCEVSDTENGSCKNSASFYSSWTGLSSLVSTLLWVPIGMD